MSEKPEALRLADELDAYHNAPHHKLAAIELRCHHYELRRLHAENERLREEIDALRADAERYRLLRRGQRWSVINGIGDALRAEELDAAIDAAKEAALRREGTNVHG